MKYSILIKRLFIIAKTKWLLQALKGNIFSFASFEIVSNLKQMVPKLDQIIDVGANSGQFTKAASHFYPNAGINSFEPLPDLFAKIENEFKSKKNIAIHNIALGNENGRIKFNKNINGHTSSVLNISAANIHFTKEENDLDQINVEIKKLDNLTLFDKKTGELALLKLDVQGYELEVLKGGEETIMQIDYIVIEANLEQLYTNQPSFTETNAYLNSKGFELLGMLDFNLGKKNKYIEIDFLYKKTSK